MVLLFNIISQIILNIRLTYLLLLIIPTIGFSQSIDFETITKSKPVKISGVISANSVFYNSKQNNSRQPFTYFAQGTLNVSIYSFSIPITYNYSNQGENLGYQLPFNLNRLSLHPKYKWITGHIGTVSMSFSPYTLNGHQFTGGGVELTPKGPLKIALMAGQLLKATNDDPDPRTQPAFERFGYGFKTELIKQKWELGVTSFYAKDDISSLDSIPEVKNVLPQENFAISLRGKAKLNKNWSLSAEYASTTITKDLRSQSLSNKKLGLTSFLIPNTTSTANFDAFKTNIDYTIGSIRVGLGYERIDPGYETLGAYFFNNDFENITLNASNTFFNDKLSLDINIGRQRDDLNNNKANKTSRTIGAANATLNLNKRTTITGSYSNLTSFTNVKPSQFEDINDSDLTDEAVENLDYRQLSQNASLGINYILSEKKEQPQTLFFNYNLNDVANEQGGVVRLGDASTFHNFGLGHTINFTASTISLNSSVNATYNTIGREDATTWGPSISIGKQLLKKTLNTQLSLSYNQSKNTSASSNALNIRLGGTYSIKKKHNFSLNTIQLVRNSDANSTLKEFTATFGYNYAFGLKRPKIKFPEWKKKYSDTVKIDYKKYHYLDIPKKITPQILNITELDEFKFLENKNKMKLRELENQLIDAEKEDKRLYKTVAIAYLKCLNDYVDFEEKYYSLLFKSFEQLKIEAEASSEDFEKELVFLVETSKNNPRQDALVKKAQIRYNAHQKLLKTLNSWNITAEKIRNPDYQIKPLVSRYLKTCFDKFDNGASDLEIIKFLEIRWADYFHKKSKNEN